MNADSVSTLRRHRFAGVLIAALLLIGLVQPVAAAAPAPSYLRQATVNQAPRTAIAWGADSVRISVAVSRALYTSADGVLLATTAPSAKKVNGTPGLPILLTPKTAAQRKLVAAELKRLGAATVLPVDADARAAAKKLAGVTVARDAGQLSADRVRLGHAALLVSASAKKKTSEGLAVARVTGKRLGATVISLHGNDPRADGAAVKKLAKAAPDIVIGIAAKLGPVSRFKQRVATAMTGKQLPGGGQVMFPGRTLVALYGYPGSSALGVLGHQGLNASIKRVKKLAKKYRKQVSGPVVPTFEIIATVASADPGADKMYSRRASIATLKPWVDRATASGLYVVLDLQPGRMNFLDQAKLYEELLKNPRVGLALDPEWRLKPNQVHLQQIGSVSAKEVNSVISWLDKLVVDNNLPQKVLVLHQFTLGMLRNSHRIQTNRDGVSVLIHMDGHGTQANKTATWNTVTKAAPKGVTFGWKNFTAGQDKPMLTPKQTMKVRPRPVMVSYQ